MEEQSQDFLLDKYTTALNLSDNVLDDKTKYSVPSYPKYSLDNLPITYSPDTRYPTIPPPKRRFFIREVSPWYLPSFVLGMTDCEGNIWIRKYGDYKKDNTRRHELVHNLLPPPLNRDEKVVEAMTEAGYPYDLSQFELVYV